MLPALVAKDTAAVELPVRPPILNTASLVLLLVPIKRHCTDESDLHSLASHEDKPTAYTPDPVDMPKLFPNIDKLDEPDEAMLLGRRELMPEL